MEVCRFLEIVSRLKHLPRKGWVLRGVSQPETVAGHMYRMAMSAFLLPSHLNTTKIMKMALVHDLAESIVGDITPQDQIPISLKKEQELKAMLEITQLLPDWSHAEVLQLWNEYEDLSSEEALIVKDLDKFDMILQGLEYEKQQNKDLSEFFGGIHIFRTEIIRKWAESVYDQRKEFLQNCKNS